MQKQGIAPHEAFELHELLTSENLSATKTATMAGLVTDSQLKSMFQQDLTVTQDNIRELQGLLQQASFSSFSTTGATSTTTGSNSRSTVM